LGNEAGKKRYQVSKTLLRTVIYIGEYKKSKREKMEMLGENKNKKYAIYRR